MIIRVLNLNCWLLPFPFSLRNNKRLKEIILLIKTIKPDIIALQEVWMNKYTAKIEHELSDYFFIKSPKGSFNKSGLLTGSLLKPKSAAICSFPVTKEHCILERIAKKGYHRLELPNNLVIFNTHLYASKVNTSNSITESQFKTLQTEANLKPCILAGDLNLDETDLRKIKTEQFFHLSKNSPISEKNPYTHFLFRKPYYSNSKIDHILTTRNNEGPVSEKYIYTPVLSDHFALIGIVNAEKM